MFRSVLVVAAALGAGLLVPPATAQTDKPKAGEPLKGQIGGEPVQFGGTANTGTAGIYAAEVPVDLKEGESITVSVTVVGTNRAVAAHLLDPKGKVVGGSKNLDAKTTRFTVDEVSVTGKFKIVIGSPQVGGYTLTVTGPAAEGLTEKALDLKIDRLKKELAEAEAALKALKGSNQK